MVQWFRVTQDRRTSCNSDTKVPEKEFLLVHAQRINTRSKSLPMREGEIDPLITKWVHLVTRSYLFRLRELRSS